MTYVDSPLDGKALRALEKLGTRQLIVGLPAYKNSRTIGNVMTAIADGISRHFPEMRGLIVVADGGSTDDTVAIAESTPLPDAVASLVTCYQGITGKGSAIRAILQAADLVHGQACAIMDADLRSVTPDWVERLFGPIVAGKAEFVTPVYTRDRHEVTINDLIAYPMTRMLYGRDIRQPLGGEVSVSAQAWRTFLAKDVWETDVARFGIHVWMTTLAINSRWQLYQAPLGTKTHDYKDPTVGFEPKFLQIVGTLFRLMSIHRRIWPTIESPIKVPLWGSVDHLDPEPVPTTRQTLWQGFAKGVKRYRRNLTAVLNADQRELLDGLLGDERQDFPEDTWARMVVRFAVVYNRGEGDPDKVALSLLPLYYARKASLLQQLEGEPWTAVEEAIQSQARSFVGVKPLLREHWEARAAWKADRS